jgi:hypothetical protein
MITVPELTVAEKVPTSALPVSCTLAVHEPALTGVATTLQLVPEPVAVPKLTIVVEPDLQVPNVTLLVGAGSVTVIVWL